MLIREDVRIHWPWRLQVDGPGLYRAEEPPETVAGTVRPLLGATSTKGPRP